MPSETVLREFTELSMVDLVTLVCTFGHVILGKELRSPFHLGVTYSYKRGSNLNILREVVYLPSSRVVVAYGHIAVGLIKAGFHEVVVNTRTVETINKRQVEHPERPLIRISSTFFWHLSSDVDLQPISELKERADTLRGMNHEEADEYPRMKVGEQVQKYALFLLIGLLTNVPSSELRHIALMA